jgi:hypothetical protein
MADPSYIPPDHITAELEKLHQLFQSGAITAAEYTQAKAKVLSSSTPTKAPTPPSTEPTIATQIQLLNLEMQNALLQAEHNWQYERESHMIRHFGFPHEPSNADLFWAGLLSLFMTIPIIPVLALTYRSPATLVILAIFIIPPVGFFMYTKSRLTRFEQARNHYWRHQSKIRDRYEQRIKELKAQR